MPRVRSELQSRKKNALYFDVTTFEAFLGSLGFILASTSSTPSSVSANVISVGSGRCHNCVKREEGCERTITSRVRSPGPGEDVDLDEVEKSRVTVVACVRCRSDQKRCDRARGSSYRCRVVLGGLIVDDDEIGIGSNASTSSSRETSRLHPDQRAEPSTSIPAPTWQSLLHQGIGLGLATTCDPNELGMGGDETYRYAPGDLDHFPFPAIPSADWGWETIGGLDGVGDDLGPGSQEFVNTESGGETGEMSLDMADVLDLGDDLAQDGDSLTEGVDGVDNTIPSSRSFSDQLDLSAPPPEPDSGSLTTMPVRINSALASPRLASAYPALVSPGSGSPVLTPASPARISIRPASPARIATRPPSLAATSPRPIPPGHAPKSPGPPSPPSHPPGHPPSPNTPRAMIRTTTPTPSVVQSTAITIPSRDGQSIQRRAGATHIGGNVEWMSEEESRSRSVKAVQTGFFARLSRGTGRG